MRFSTRLKLMFSKKLRDSISCVGCPLSCYGTIKFGGDLLCSSMLYTYEKRVRHNKECLKRNKK